MSILIVDIHALGPVLNEGVDVFIAASSGDPEALETTENLRDALARFLDIAEHVDSGSTAVDKLSPGDMNRIANHVLNLLDALVTGIQGKAEPAQQARLDRAVAGTAVWLARAGARLEYLEPVANALAAVANGTQDAAELAELCVLMEEVILAAGPDIKADLETADPMRPWRVMNLNWGIIATRSHDTALMQRTFDRMAEHIPADLPAFFREGMAEMERVGYPQLVRDVMQRYHDQWQHRTIH